MSGKRVHASPAVYEHSSTEDARNQEVEGAEVTVCEEGGDETSGRTCGVQDEEEGKGSGLIGVDDVSGEGRDL